MTNTIKISKKSGSRGRMVGKEVAVRTFQVEKNFNIYGESSEKPKKWISEKYKKIKLKYKYFTDCNWGIRHSYNLCIDSGSLGREKDISFIISGEGGHKENE